MAGARPTLAPCEVGSSDGSEVLVPGVREAIDRPLDGTCDAQIGHTTGACRNCSCPGAECGVYLRHHPVQLIARSGVAAIPIWLSARLCRTPRTELPAAVAAYKWGAGYRWWRVIGLLTHCAAELRAKLLLLDFPHITNRRLSSRPKWPPGVECRGPIDSGRWGYITRARVGRRKATFRNRSFR